MKFGRARGALALIAAGLLVTAGAVVMSEHAALAATSGAWSATGGTYEPAEGAAVAAFGSGANTGVLAAGGDLVNGPRVKSAEVYNPNTGHWSPVADMHVVRLGGTAIALPDGRVAVVGGEVSSGVPFERHDSLEIYDPTTNSWSSPVSLGEVMAPAAALLHDGKILLTGGVGTTGATSAASIFDPATNTISPTGAMQVARAQFSALTLSDGKVLVATTPDDEGCCSPPFSATASAELYDPTSGTWVLTGGLQDSHHFTPERLFLLPGGTIAAVGTHLDDDYERVIKSEIYDPVTNSWSAPIASADDQQIGSVGQLGDGSLVETSLHGTTNIFDAASKTWSVGPRPRPRLKFAQDVTLPDGRLLVTGGAATSAIFTAGATQDQPSPMTFDPTYGTNGSASLGGGFWDLTTDVLGRAYVIADHAIVRYGPHGQLDQTWANNGTLDLTANGARPTQVLASTSGLVYVLSPVEAVDAADPDYMLVQRFTPAGLPDPSFGQQGQLKILGAPAQLPIGTMRLRPGGGVYVLMLASTGFVGWAAGGEIVAVTSGGLADTAFNPSGPKPGRVTLSPGFVTANRIAVDSADRVLVECEEHCLERFLPDGAPDPSFGSGGQTEIASLTGFMLDFVATSGGIYAVGLGSQAFPSGQLIKLGIDGTLDHSFGDPDSPGSVSVGWELPAGSSYLYVVGDHLYFSGADTDDQWAVKRFTLAGQVDGGFGTDGVRVASAPPGQPDAHLLGGGSTSFLANGDAILAMPTYDGIALSYLQAQATPAPLPPVTQEPAVAVAGGAEATSASSDGTHTLSTSSEGVGLAVQGWYEAPPADTPVFRGAGGYFDLWVQPGSSLNKITTRLCPATAQDVPVWFDPSSSSWLPVSGASFDGTCTVIQIDDSSQPSISQLTGTVFALVPVPTISTIQVSPSSGSTPLGLSQQFTATAVYSDGHTEDVTSLASWSSSVPSVLSVGAGGLGHPASVGATQVSAQLGAVTGTTGFQVTPAFVVSVAVTPGNLTLGKGLSQQMIGTATMSDGTAARIMSPALWSSSNPSVAKVDILGRLTTMSPGTTVISVAASGILGTTMVTITPPVVMSVAVSPATSSIAKGQTVQYSGVATMSDGTQEPVETPAAFSSSNSSAVVVDANGLAKGVGTGSATITLRASGISGTATIGVGTARPVSVVVTPNAPTVVKGLTRQFSAVATYTDGSQLEVSNTAVWASSTPSVATITASGNAAAVSVGSATISATIGGITSTTSLTVVAPTLVAGSLNLTPNTSSVAVGTNQQVSLIGWFTDGTMPNLTSAATWMSSNTSVATVSSSGLVTGMSAGSVTISAKYGSNPAVVATLMVEKGPATLSAPGAVRVSNGLSATVTYSTRLVDAAGVAIAGRTVVFAAAGSTACSATTNSSGVGSCSHAYSLLLSTPAPSIGSSYTVTFGGDANHLNTAAVGKVVAG